MNNTHGKAIATLVLGIIGVVSILTGAFSFIGLICAIVGIILGVQVKKELPYDDPDRKLAQAGLICSIIGAVVAGIGVLCVACGIAAVGASSCIGHGLYF